jgi:hypothetical protein
MSFASQSNNNNYYYHYYYYYYFSALDFSVQQQQLLLVLLFFSSGLFSPTSINEFCIPAQDLSVQTTTITSQPSPCHQLYLLGPWDFSVQETWETNSSLGKNKT